MKFKYMVNCRVLFVNKNNRTASIKRKNRVCIHVLSGVMRKLNFSKLSEVVTKRCYVIAEVYMEAGFNTNLIIFP